MLARLSVLWPSKQALLPFLAWLPMVNRQSLRADMIAGLTGAIIVLPQGVAFAIIAGMPPQYGLYTAMVTPVIAALFGSSWHLISGPTTAISIVVFSTISRYAEVGSPEFVSMALTLTFMAGAYQLAFGLARLGILVNFVSHTVVVGFTAGAAILIATSQMKNVMGIPVPKGESFLITWVDLAKDVMHTNVPVFAVAIGTLIVAILVKKFVPKIPNLLVALLAGTGIAFALGGQTAGIGMVGEIPRQLPPPSLPDFSFETIRMLGANAFAVALLGLIEAVSISRSIAAKSHQRIDGNQEFIGQGLSNVVGAFFSSYAGSGSFTRSGVNYSAGARTPMSALFAAAFLAITVMAVAPLAAYLPIPAMAGVILLVAYNLIDFKGIKHVIESSKSETAILATTMGATLFLELEFAIYLGVLLSLIVFLGRTSYPQIVSLAPGFDHLHRKKTLLDVNTQPVHECPKLKILRLDMAVYFGSVDHLQKRLQNITDREGITHILIIGSGINLIDLSGAEVLVHEAHRLKALGGGLYFAELKPTVYERISRFHLIKEIGNAHFFDEKTVAIKTLQRLLRRNAACEACPVHVFEECRVAQAAE